MSEFAWVTCRSADGLTLMARDYAARGGEGRLPVVCLHGLTRNSRDFEAVAPWIAARGRRVIVPDVRGRGRSDYAPDPATYQPAAYVADVVAMLDALGEARAVVVGTSMGGLIAMAMAALAPSRLAGAALNDVGPKLRPEGLARIASYAGQAPTVTDWAGAAEYARRINAAAFPGYGAADWAAFARRIFREGEPGRPELDYDPNIMQPMREAAASGAPPPDLWPLFEALTRDRPVLLVRGALSDLLGAEGAAEMRARAPRMAYAEVPGVGHAPMLTEPEAQAALGGFLDRLH
jgi:pimeloyl-ACP methyl ester carboxylesterase